MAAKVDSVSAEESQQAQSPISKSTSANSASGSKVSIFGVKSGFVIPKNKSGFVIPKNKLSGSLIPIIRSGGKVEPGDVGKEDNTKQVQRQTRWGSDLTQDAVVRKGRSLAYQTRLEQITQQLKSESLEPGDDQNSQLSGQLSHKDSIDKSNVTKLHSRELLELEKHEVIGEILRLNPGYKPPPDYKPVLKEAKVPIPLKAYPGYNFIGLVLAPASNTQKRLEEETGAKVRVYGIKVDTKEKCEIARSDAAEAQAVYDELFVHISADSYEKVDAAVALIELLFTPVSAVSAVVSTTSSSVIGDSVVEQSQSDSASAHPAVPVGVVNQGMVQPIVVPTHSTIPQFQSYAGLWHPHVSPNVGAPPSAGFMHPPVTNSIQFTAPANFPNASFSGGHPTLSIVPGNIRGVVTWTEPYQAPDQATVPPSYTNTIQQAPPAYPAMVSSGTSVLAAVPPLGTSGSMPSTRPTHLGPQPTAGFPYRSLTTPPSSSPGFSGGPLPLRPNNMMHVVPPSSMHMVPPSSMHMVPPSSMPLQRHHPSVPLSNVAIPSQPSMPTPAVNAPSATNFTPRLSFPIQSSSVPSNLPSQAVGSLPPQSPMTTFLPPQAPVASPRPFSGPVPVQSPTIVASAQVSLKLPVLAQSAPLPGMHGQASISTSLSGPLHQHGGSALGNNPNFPPKMPLATHVSVPPITSPKPPLPGPGDFTFQPHKAHVPVSHSQSVPHTLSQASPGVAQVPVNQNASQIPLAPPAAPSFRPAPRSPVPVGNPGGAARPQSASQMGPPNQVPIQAPSFSSGGPLPGNPTNILAPPRVPAFPNTNAPLSPQVSLRSFAPTLPHASTSILARPVPLVQPHPPFGHQHHGLSTPSQHSGVSLPYVPVRPAVPGGGQSYDPFSPTSVTAGPKRLEDDPGKARKPDTDAEYEDLMASVGVR